MGGLLAREYIESDYYEDDIDQLITIGTPHLGSTKGLFNVGSRGIHWILGIFI